MTPPPPDLLLADARLSGANGECCAIGIYAAVVVPGTSRIALINPGLGQAGFYVVDLELPTPPQAICTDGTKLYVLGVNAIYIVTGAHGGAPVLAATVPLYAFPVWSTATSTEIAPWIVLVNGFLAVPYGRSGVQTFTTSGVPAALLPDLTSRAGLACANGSLLYVLDGGRASGRTLNVDGSGRLTVVDNGPWMAPNCRAVTGCFMDAATLVVSTDHRFITFTTADPNNPAFATTVTLPETFNGSLYLNLPGNYYAFTNETVPLQQQGFDLPSLGGTVIGQTLVIVHGAVGMVEVVYAPRGYLGVLAVVFDSFIPLGTITGGILTAPPTQGLTWFCIGQIQSSGAGLSLAQTAYVNATNIAVLAPDNTITALLSHGPMALTQAGTYWLYANNASGWIVSNTRGPVAVVGGCTLQIGSDAPLVLALTTPTISWDAANFSVTLTADGSGTLPTGAFSPQAGYNLTGSCDRTYTHFGTDNLTITGAIVSTLANGVWSTPVPFAYDLVGYTDSAVYTIYPDTLIITVADPTGAPALPSSPLVGYPLVTTVTLTYDANFSPGAIAQAGTVTC